MTKSVFDGSPRGAGVLIVVVQLRYPIARRAQEESFVQVADSSQGRGGVRVFR